MGGFGPEIYGETMGKPIIPIKFSGPGWFTSNLAGFQGHFDKIARVFPQEAYENEPFASEKKVITPPSHALAPPHAPPSFGAILRTFCSLFRL